jgi:hypothetical protein
MPKFVIGRDLPRSRSASPWAGVVDRDRTVCDALSETDLADPAAVMLASYLATPFSWLQLVQAVLTVGYSGREDR